MLIATLMFPISGMTVTQHKVFVKNVPLDPPPPFSMFEARSYTYVQIAIPVSFPVTGPVSLFAHPLKDDMPSGSFFSLCGPDRS